MTGSPLPTVLVTLLLCSAYASAQDLEYIRAVERAQQERPAALTSMARIAPEKEPGVPLVIHGRAVADDGTTPLAGAVVFAYHTDIAGVYDYRPGAAAHSWRLKGWARTDTQGRFEFRTIRPGAYPSRNQAAHVHFTIFTADGARYHAGELQFEDDSLVRASERDQSRAAGAFGSVRMPRMEGSTQHVDFALRLNPRNKF